MLVVCNFTPVARHDILVEVPVAGFWHEVLNGDAEVYGGKGSREPGRGAGLAFGTTSTIHAELHRPPRWHVSSCATTLRGDGDLLERRVPSSARTTRRGRCTCRWHDGFRVWAPQIPRAPTSSDRARTTGWRSSSQKKPDTTTSRWTESPTDHSTSSSCRTAQGIRTRRRDLSPQGVHGPSVGVRSLHVRLERSKRSNCGAVVALLSYTRCTWEASSPRSMRQRSGGRQPWHLRHRAMAFGERRRAGSTRWSRMPMAQFPGIRNWGYDGVFPFAVQETPTGVRRRSNDSSGRAHRSPGSSVILDVVYNHSRPRRGTVHSAFTGSYISSDRYSDAVGSRRSTSTGPGSDEVRRYLVANALGGFSAFHVDGLQTRRGPRDSRHLRRTRS